jgi:TPR repeat protein
VDALNNLGEMHESGEGVIRNLKAAVDFYQQAANGGHVDAQTNLGYLYEHGADDDEYFSMD